MRISKHIIATSEEHKHRFVVDAAGIGGREKLLPGEVSLNIQREVSRGHIRQAWNETEGRLRRRSELSLPGCPTAEMRTEGPNVKLFQMLQGGNYQPCIKRNRERRKEN